MIGVIGLALIVAASTGAAYYAGLRSRPVTRARTTPAANARSLAQLNRHLNERLDATQVKLEAAMDRAFSEKGRGARVFCGTCGGQEE
jgi:hypothetical protein